MTVFICKDCVFLCNYESDYKRHLKTKRTRQKINFSFSKNTIKEKKVLV